MTQLTLRYDGTEVDAHIVVVQKKNDVVVFDDTVQPGDEFTFDGQAKKGTLNTEISVFVNEGLNVKIHTSCSQPIGPGFVFGDFTVIAGFSRNGGALSCSTSNPRLLSGDRPSIYDLNPQAETADEFVLEPAYPNPFNPTTTLRFSLPEAGEVRMVVYDMLGRIVKVLVDGTQPAGTHAVTFDASDLPSGTYLYHLETASGTQSGTMLLVK